MGATVNPAPALRERVSIVPERRKIGEKES